MPAANRVNHSKFPHPRVLYEDDAFAIAWGTYDGKRECLGMRWSGGPKDPGYPKLFLKPVWFVLPDELSAPFVKALLGTAAARNQALLRVLNQLRETGALKP